MAVRSLNEIWVDANFKETQLRDLRIGQPVDLYVDMYGGQHVFKGRVSGFTMGTGSTLALLPPENATGNFVKVVQRLPVRIDLVDYDPDRHRCSSAPRSSPMSTSTSRQPGPMPGSSCRPMCRSRRSRGRGRERIGRRREMTGAALSSPARRSAIPDRRSIPWVVAAVVVVPTFMEVLDTTIAVVALRYIAGGLSATVDDGEWVITSYLAANAIILPITGWLIAHLGRRNYFLLSIAVFTLASGLCGMATAASAS